MSRSSEQNKKLNLGLGMAGLVLGLTGLSYGLLSGNSKANAEQISTDTVREAFQARFIETTPDEVNCDGFGPLCQIIAGKTVLYIDPDAKHAFIGNLYDLESKRDLTQVALRRIRPEGSDAPVAEPASASRDPFNDPRRVSWDELPFEAAIVHNPGAPLKVAVFSDLKCGHCFRFAQAMRGVKDIEVREFLQGSINRRSLEDSLAIGCADDPAKALSDYWTSQTTPDAVCDRDIVGPARQAAQTIGARGTPTFIRPDGAVLTGFYGVDAMRDWLNAVPSTIASVEE